MARFNVGQGIGGGLGGALTGAGTGAALGSFLPGIGNLLGAGIGAGIGGLGGLLGGGLSQGRDAQRGVQSRYSPEIQEKFNQLLPALLEQLAQGGDFSPIEQQARSQFQQQGIPSLAERFTALGGGRISSPAFASQAGSAQAGLETNLAALRSQYGLQRQNLLQNLLQLGQQEPYYAPREPSSFETLMGTLLPVVGKAAGSYLKSPAFADFLKSRR